jgi:hypothetical protein
LFSILGTPSPTTPLCYLVTADLFLDPNLQYDVFLQFMQEVGTGPALASSPSTFLGFLEVSGGAVLCCAMLCCAVLCCAASWRWAAALCCAVRFVGVALYVPVGVGCALLWVDARHVHGPCCFFCMKRRWVEGDLTVCSRGSKPLAVACPCVSATSTTSSSILQARIFYQSSHPPPLRFHPYQPQVLTALAAGEKGARSMYDQLRGENAFPLVSWRRMFQLLGTVVRQYMPGERAVQHGTLLACDVIAFGLPGGQQASCRESCCMATRTPIYLHHCLKSS